MDCYAGAKPFASVSNRPLPFITIDLIFYPMAEHYVDRQHAWYVVIE